ncbi:MAG: HAD-IA family hydrolase [Candidatus Aminicenantes bacterium]|nr:HAD-IA family hydrolase [Candidatus Aminicenantes bacterium]NIM77750.1 HAD-IA family hydrolase [Candidatus Aminicenantes bacterium]NIN17063.1 HAD-IA family hydrolase [Candidatus Aminicenantes bacterium]NIN40956.1 HAD-IA family hydrolase [Candidatus Aminicenantes bacterium]NIN83761.1 HAD-IA family hydrolase [Candidatus Aminicenantes bacterium]
MKRKLLKGIRVISFDVGFTLIKTEPPVGEVYATIAARFGFHLNPEETHSRFRKTWVKQNELNRQKTTDNALADEERSYQWWKGIFKESIGDTIPPEDLETVFKVCYQEYAKGEYWRIYPEVCRTLTTLRSRGFHLVVLSNWDHRLLRTLKDLQLDRFFEKIYISTRIGYAKPDPRAFLYIIEDLKIPKQALLHIGDTLEDDIIGAQKANIQCVCIDRRGKYQSIPGPVPIISSLSELLE